MSWVIDTLPGVAPSLLGESPVWHPDDRALWWLDIPGRTLNRWHEASGAHRAWDLPCEPGCIAPLLEGPGGQWLMAMRDGLWRFDPARGAQGERTALAEAPYDSVRERFNDGKADALGRLWAGTIYEPRDATRAALYRFADGALSRQAGDITVSNGLAFSPDARTLYWADTKAHCIHAFDFDLAAGTLSRQREFKRFEPKAPDQDLATYGGRPDGAAVDAEGAYWIAMFEGQRLLRLAPDGRLLQELPLPVRCPTMPCFGGADLRTLFITTSRENRPASELAQQPWAGCVLRLRVDVPGLPVNFARAGS